MATVPQCILDPKLHSHIRYGARTYPYAWLIIPISLIVLIFSYLTARYLESASRNIRILGLPLWFVLSTAGSIFLFPPEIPHGVIIITLSVWYILSILNIFIHNNRQSEADIQNSDIYKEARIEYLKHFVTLWRDFSFGMVAGFFALLITSVVSIHSYNNTYLKNKDEIFIVNNFSNLQIAVFSLYYITGPIYESFKNLKYHIGLFLKLK
ncbi:MAG: hypothetical protein ACM3SY_07715 [Candidatus Omnitrophota bacterium]